jgi:hypothetical protein
MDVRFRLLHVESAIAQGRQSTVTMDSLVIDGIRRSDQRTRQRAMLRELCQGCKRSYKVRQDVVDSDGILQGHGGEVAFN